MDNILLAFLLTMIAGLTTGIGGIITFFVKRDNSAFLSFSLGFSAGVMIYVSFVEIFAESQDILALAHGLKSGSFIAVMGFFFGMLLIGIIDHLVPKTANPHEMSGKMYNYDKPAPSRLMHTGLFTALAIAIHNFPEGIATFISAMNEPKIAIPIVFAVALHNIPEGVAVSAPIYYATGNRKKAVLFAFASGLAEPLGAVAAYLILMPFMNDTLFGFVLAAVAGIMVFISLDELLPAAREFGRHHLSIYGMVSGMAVMALGLLLFL